jgi:hypothetical protein
MAGKRQTKSIPKQGRAARAKKVLHAVKESYADKLRSLVKKRSEKRSHKK